MYLNYWKTAYSTNLWGIDAHYRAFVLPQTIAHIKTGMSYPPVELANLVQINNLPASDGPIAFILAGGNAHFAGLETTHYPNSSLYYQYKVAAQTNTQIIAHRQACNYGRVDLIFTDHSACASSLHVLAYAKYLIDHQDFERVIVLAVEDQVNSANLRFFEQAGVKPSPLPSAFDQKNVGFHLGQGAVTAAFERTPKPGGGALARLIACASASENNTNSLGMRDDGQGYIKAIHLLGSAADRVGLIKTHGTGTPLNNYAERRAIWDVFGRDVLCTSLKPTLGHTLGASGLLESVVVLQELKETKMVPAIANRTTDDAQFLSKSVRAPKGDVLALAAGMGNLFSAAAWERL